MNNKKTVFGLALAVVITLGVAVGLSFGTPLKASAANCSTFTDGPHFNSFPVSTLGLDCTDYPLIMAKKGNGNWTPYHIDATAGDEITIQVYVHNSSAPNVQGDTANDVKVTTTAQLAAGDSHMISSTISAKLIMQPSTTSGNVIIHTNSNESLEIVPGSSILLDANGGTLNAGQPYNSVWIGDQAACYEHIRFVRFKVRVVAPLTPTPTPTKTPTPTASPTKAPDVSCSLTPQVGRSIYYFSSPLQNYLLANSSQANATMGPNSFALGAGTYRVSLIGFDDHFEANQYQPNEQYKIIVKNGSTVVQTSNPSADIADKSQYSPSIVTTSNFVVSQNTNSITAVHAVYPNSNPNSVAPVCAVFDLISTPTPVPTPTPTPTLTPTPTPTPTMTPSPIPAPSAIPYCTSNTAKATISWSEANRGSQGYTIDIDTDNNWTNGFWNKVVSSNTTTTAPDGFTSTNNGSALILANSTLYYARVYYNATGEHSPTINFTSNNCGTTGTPTLTITKLVRNVTQNSGDTDTVNAKPNDLMEFSIRVQNIGTANANNVRVWDTLPGGLTYQTGSSTYGDDIVAGGVGIGTLSAGQQITVRFRALTREDNYFPIGTTALTNTAYTKADTLSTITDKAYVQVTRTQTATLVCSPASQNVTTDQYAYFSVSGGNGSYTWSTSTNNANPSTGYGSAFSTRFTSSGTYDVTVRDSANQIATCRTYVGSTNGNGYISIDKLARNISTGSGEMNTVSARPNDTIEFVLRVTTSGNTTINNIRVSDTLPTGLRYLSGTTTVDGSYTGDGIVSGGINIGSAYGSRTFVVRFQTKVDDSYYYGTYVTYTTYTNIAYASADGTNLATDSAYVNVTRDNTTTTTNSQFTIEKLGRNISKGEVQYKNTVNGSPDDTIDFQIKVRSTSSTTLNNVLIRDVLPGALLYIANTTSINNLQTVDGLIANGINGINVGPLAPNQEVVIRFDAYVRTADYFAKGVTPVTNIAYARADGTAEISTQLPINIYNGSILGIASTPKTGATSMVALGVTLAIALTLVYMAYTSTGVFRKRNAWAVANRMRFDKDKFNFGK